MTSNAPHLQRVFHPAAKLAMGRTMMKSGRKRGDLGLVRAGKELFDQTNAELDGQGLADERPELFSEPGAEGKPQLVMPGTDRVSPIDD